MNLKLSSKDIRTVKFGSIAVLGIIIFFKVIFPWFDDWSGIRKDMNLSISAIKPVISSKESFSAKDISVMTAVPVVELPEELASQKLKFQSELNNVLKKCRIMFKSLKALPVSTSKNSLGFRTLLFQCQGTCSYQQVLSFLSELVKNPHFVAVENLQLKVNEKNRSSLDLTVTISTYVR